MFLKSQTKKICLLFCGGSIFSATRPKSAVFEENDIKYWMEEIPEIEIIADIDPEFVLGEKETDQINPNFWIRLAKLIYKKIDDYDGFVIIHDISSIVYTASALSFMLKDLKKPVVLTGSLAHLQNKEFKNYDELGFKANLINAVQAATMDFAEVALMFGNRLIRGNRAQYVISSSLNLFDSPNLAPLAKIDFGIKFSDQRIKKNPRKTTKLAAFIDTKIQNFEFFPGANHDLLNKIARLESHGILIKLYGTLPKIFILQLKKLAAEIPLIIFASQNVKLEDIESLFVVSNMTYETTLVKFMWALGQTKNIEEIKRIMKTNYAGEIY